MSDGFNHGFPDNKYNKHAWVVGKPEIGENVWIGAFCLVDGTGPLKIGRGSNLASGCQILTHNTIKRCISERSYSKIDILATEIGEFCFIGANAVVLMGAKIGHHSVVAAGAVVKEGAKFPAYSLIAGVPGKKIGSSKKYLTRANESNLTISIPAFNEEKTIKSVVEEAIKYGKKLTRQLEILLIDDGSTDKTYSIMRKLAKKYPQVRIIKHPDNQGFASVIRECLTLPRNSLVFLAPADGQFDFNQLASFVESIRGNDAAIGYRVENDEPLQRKIQSYVFHRLCRVLLNIKLKEISSVSLWRKRALEDLDFEMDSRSAGLLPSLIYQGNQNKYRFVEVPIKWRKRLGGRAKGKINLWLILSTFWSMLIMVSKIRYNDIGKELKLARV